MLPSRCIHPPCRNMDVNGDAKRGIHCRSVGNRASVNSTAGIAPKAATARRLCAVSSERCHKKTQAQLTIRAIVTKGFKAEGESSLSGIIVAAPSLLDASLLLRAGLLHAGLLLDASLLLHAGLLRLRLLARDLLEHHFHPLADHSDPSAAAGLTMASIAATVSG